MKTSRLQVDHHVKNAANEDAHATKVRPHVHGLVVEHEEGACRVPVRMEPDSVPRLEVDVVDHEVVDVWVIDVSNIRLGNLLTLVLDFPSIADRFVWLFISWLLAGHLVRLALARSVLDAPTLLFRWHLITILSCAILVYCAGCS